MVDVREFANPPAEYRVKPFWFWNSRLDQAELLEQLQDMYDHGIGGVFIHARFGLETEYLSDEWFRLVRKCVEKAAALSMEVWLYDENPFPSGIGGLHVSAQPSFRTRYVECLKRSLEAGERKLTVGNGRVLGVRCLSGGNLLPMRYGIGPDNQVELESPVCDQDTVCVYVERVLESKSGKYFGIDYLNPEAVTQFIQLTHEKYLEHLGEFFGKTIKGFFTDEPTLLPWHQDLDWYVARGDGHVVVWNEEIPTALRDRYGYHLDEVLDAIFLDRGDRAELVRRDLRALISEMYEATYFAALEDWCHRHGLQLTGHVLLEEGLYFNTIFEGNIMKNLGHLDMPGTDHLTNTAEQPGAEFMVGTAPHLPKVRTNVQGQKLVASSAHLSGKTAVISESFGLGGWGMTLQDMRWITNWQYSLGINRLCPHAFFYSIEGFRKLDAPPCHMHNLSFRHFRLFADYVARASYVLSQGIHRADVAVLYPLSEFQSVYIAGVQQRQDKLISDAFDLACACLPKLHYDYDVVGEHHLLEATVSSGTLSLRGEAFKLLIVPTLGKPPVDCLNRVFEFALAGGRILFLTTTDGIDRIREAWGAEHSLDMWHYSLASQSMGIGDQPCGWIDVDYLSSDERAGVFMGLLEAWLQRHLDPCVMIHGVGSDRMYYHQRFTKDEDVFFFANTSREMPAEVKISLGSIGRAVAYDCETGAVRDLDGSRECNGQTVFAHCFEPGGSFVVGVRRHEPVRSMSSSAHAAREAVRPEVIQRIPTDGWGFELETPNALPLTDWQFSVKTGGMGSSFRYETSIEIGEGVQDLALMLDDIEYREAFMGSMDLQVLVNGQQAKGPSGYYVDKKFKTWQIGHHMTSGLNVIEVIINHASWSGAPHVMVSVPVLLGRFRLCESEGRYQLLAPTPQISLGSWTDKGYAFLSGTAVYSREFVVEAPYSYLALEFDRVGEYVEVSVNDQLVGSLVWPPWTLDITDHVRQGKNSLALRVTNTLFNVLERKPRPSGILGTVTMVGRR